MTAFICEDTILKAELNVHYDLEKIPVRDKFKFGEGLALVGKEEEFSVCCNIKNEETF